MNTVLQYPFDALTILKKKKSIKRTLLEKQVNWLEKKFAILGGSTTSEIRNCLELFLLNDGIKPSFYESGYNAYYEESIFVNEGLVEFAPDFIYLHLTVENIIDFPKVTDSKEIVQEKIMHEFMHLRDICESLKKKYAASIVVNNFAMPSVRNLGNIDSLDIHGYGYFIDCLNEKIHDYVRENKNLLLNDVHYLSARFGLDRWYDSDFWHAYKIAMAYEAIPGFAYNLSKVISASLGKSKKCLVLDLDNTLWGGVIGDDGLGNIKLGKETPVGEAYTAFQKYLLTLKERGVILAICSKNNLQTAQEGFSHPDSMLKVEDFTVFKANWQEKYLNIIEIAEEINIGLDSLVFIDDNPVERKNVKDNLPEVTVPDIDVNDVSSYIRIIDGAGYFETVSISADDLKRNESYKDNVKRKSIQREFASYDDFLASLDMKAEIKPFVSLYLDRITQLINKTNQFNLTTKRYTLQEIEQIAADAKYLTLYGRLEDKFGDNGLVSVMIGRQDFDVLYIDIWLMSCRVIKRDMEKAMFDVFISMARERGVKKIIGYYFKTAKNEMVKDIYKDMGFVLLKKDGEDTVWQCDVNVYNEMNYFIKVNR